MHASTKLFYKLPSTTKQNSNPDQSQFNSMPAKDDSARVSPISQKSLPIKPTVSSPFISCLSTKSCFSSATPNKENTKSTDRIVHTKWPITIIPQSLKTKKTF